MGILDNSSRLNNLIVSQGLRVASGDSASLYILYKKLEKRVKQHLKELLKQYSNDTITKTQWNKIQRYLEITEYKCITRLDGIISTCKLNQYSNIEDTNTIIYEVTGRNVDVRIQTILSK